MLQDHKLNQRLQLTRKQTLTRLMNYQSRVYLYHKQQRYNDDRLTNQKLFENC